jgi:hypothetical protein
VSEIIKTRPSCDKRGEGVFEATDAVITHLANGMARIGRRRGAEYTVSEIGNRFVVTSSRHRVIVDVPLSTLSGGGAWAPLLGKEPCPRCGGECLLDDAEFVCMSLATVVAAFPTLSLEEKFAYLPDDVAGGLDGKYEIEGMGVVDVSDDDNTVYVVSDGTDFVGRECDDWGSGERTVRVRQRMVWTKA